jgi:hypothetical protein
MNAPLSGKRTRYHHDIRALSFGAHLPSIRIRPSFQATSLGMFVAEDDAHEAVH